jgi:hypothetical protein
MSFKIRNTVFLGAFLLLVVAGGLVYLKLIQPKALKTTEAAIKKAETEIGGLGGVHELVRQKEMMLREVRRKYESRSKVIPVNEISSQSYQYINQGLDQAGFLKFNMRFVETKSIGQYGYNTYVIEEGEGDFATLYKFLFFLENGSHLYKISNVMIDQKEAIDPKGEETRMWLSFNFNLFAYFTTVKELETSTAATSAVAMLAPFDPFNPIILSQIPTTAPEDEIDPEKVEIKAVVPGKAFVLYEHDLLVLVEGDRVWRGLVTKINPSEGKVTFMINEGGVARKIEKTIKFTKKRAR